MSIRSNVDARGLDQRILIERNFGTQASPGTIVADWQPLVVCWAKVDAAPAKGVEPYLTAGTRSRTDMVMWIRADIKDRYALTLLDRVIWKGMIHDIKDMPDQQLRGRLVALIVNSGINSG